MNAREANSMVQPQFLMCYPQHFAVSYSINPWMDPHSWANAEHALLSSAKRQWAALREVLVNQGAAIKFMDPTPGLPDLVFTANAAVILNRTALLAHFRHPERQCEEPAFAAAFRTLQMDSQIDTIEEMPENLVLEGAGDCIWDRWRGHFWMGCGPRSHRAAADVITDQFGVDCVVLELADPRFYHLDTAFCPLPSGDVIYYPGAFTPAARGIIEERVRRAQRLELELSEALEFSANAVSLGRCVVLSSCPDKLRLKLEEREFTVITTPLHAFIRSGGSACCLTLRLDQQS